MLYPTALRANPATVPGMIRRCIDSSIHWFIENPEGKKNACRGHRILILCLQRFVAPHRFIDSSNHRSTDFRFFGGRCRGKNLRFGVVLYSAHCVFFSVLLALGETNAIFFGTFGCKNLDSYTLYSGKILLNLGSFFCNFGSFLAHFGGLLALWITFWGLGEAWGLRGTPWTLGTLKGPEKGLRHPPPPFGGSLFGNFSQNILQNMFLCCFFVIFSQCSFFSENGPSKRGVNIGSAHAGACFVRVGRCRLGSILGSILESFWGPSSPLYSFLVDLGCTLVNKKIRR